MGNREGWEESSLCAIPHYIVVAYIVAHPTPARVHFCAIELQLSSCGGTLCALHLYCSVLHTTGTRVLKRAGAAEVSRTVFLYIPTEQGPSRVLHTLNKTSPHIAHKQSDLTHAQFSGAMTFSQASHDSSPTRRDRTVTY